MSEYPPESRCATHMTRRDGTTVNLYSNANAAAVDLHFRWMEKYGIDGAAVQRFVVVTTTSERTRWDLELLEEQRAAERHGRVFYVSYDVSGANPETVAGDIFNDWRHLVEDLKVTSSKRYLTDAGKPVLELWGFGVADRPGSPAVVLQLAHALKAGTPGIPPVTLVGGVAPEWRTLDGAAKSDPDWSDVYRSFDVISPWFTGRFNDSDTAVRYLRDRAGRDLAVTRKLGIDYMPVVFPGFSWSNLMRLDFGLQKPLNQIPRNCGKFYWSQIHELLAQHVTTLYVAMFDEVDEGTAIYKTIVEPKYLPSGTKLIERTLDGCTVSPDWYLRITGAARRYLSQRTVPPKSLYRAMNERP